LTDELKPVIIQNALTAAGEIKSETDRAQVLADLSPHLMHNQRVEILEKILYLYDPGPVSPLKKVVKTWQELEFDGFGKHLISFLKLVAKRERQVGFEVIGALSPALAHFSKMELIPDTYRAITDVTRWWP
jgi:hypothetical protein